MNNNLSELEVLPNETLIETFEYLDARDLFQAFYNLNFRFNILLHSLNNLSFTLSKSSNLNAIPIHCISTLVVTEEVHVDLNEFTHIHRLFLMTPTFSQIHQLYIETLPYLEHLSINFPTESFPYNMFNIYNKIFSNGFPHLKSSYLPKTDTIIQFNTWTQTLSLRKLKVGNINTCVYKAILSSCPNLHFLAFTKHVSQEIPPSCEPHINLRTMKIELPLWCSGNLSEINGFFSYVPNLEQLSIHHTVFGPDISEYLSYRWLSPSIMRYLPSLCCFNCYFELLFFGLSDKCYIENNLKQIKEAFKKVHSDQYQSRLIIIIKQL